MSHIPVLLNEVLEIFDPKPGENYIDATVNGGGHTRALLESIAPSGRVLGIDWDRGLVEKLNREKEEEGLTRLLVENDSYEYIPRICERTGFGPVHGVLFDLGYSSYHVDRAGRGFSFQRDEPLDMRYAAGASGSSEMTAAALINSAPEAELERVFREYGEERFASRIARAIVEDRKTREIATTTALVESIRRAVPGGYRLGRIHYATRVFQALRIAVNHELDNVGQGLAGALEVLAPGGTVAVISFHSLEDRVVKNFFRERQKEGSGHILTAKPIIAGSAETRVNPRSRSAKLRAFIKQKQES